MTQNIQRHDPKYSTNSNANRDSATSCLLAHCPMISFEDTPWCDTGFCVRESARFRNTWNQGVTVLGGNHERYVVRCHGCTINARAGEHYTRLVTYVRAQCLCECLESRQIETPLSKHRICIVYLTAQKVKNNSEY